MNIGTDFNYYAGKFVAEGHSDAGIGDVAVIQMKI
jgi:hypothetical protein